MSDHLYPITITQARYQGVYEGGRWCAFWSYPEDVPAEAFADDITCATWWGNHLDRVGVGDTPEAALEHLTSLWEDKLAVGFSEWRFGY